MNPLTPSEATDRDGDAVSGAALELRVLSGWKNDRHLQWIRPRNESEHRNYPSPCDNYTAYLSWVGKSANREGIQGDLQRHIVLKTSGWHDRGDGLWKLNPPQVRLRIGLESALPISEEVADDCPHGHEGNDDDQHDHWTTA